MKDIIINKCELYPDSQILRMSFVTYEKEPVRIHIDNQNTFICKNEPTNTVVKEINFDTTDEHFSEEEGDYGTEYHVTDLDFDLSTTPYNIESDILFVFIYSSGEYLEAVVPVYYEFDVYKRVYDSIRHDFKDCSKKCSGYDNSANNVILFNGIEYSIAVGDYQRASDFWKLLHGSVSNSGGCNCG